MYDAATAFSMRAHPLKKEFGLKMFSRFSGDKLLSQPFKFPIPIFDSHALAIFCKMSLFPHSTQFLSINRFQNFQLAAWCRRLTFEMCEGGRAAADKNFRRRYDRADNVRCFLMTVDYLWQKLATAPSLLFQCLLLRPGRVLSSGGQLIPMASFADGREGTHSRAQGGAQEFIREILT